MNIPFCILKERISISDDCYEYHQNLARRLYNSSRRTETENIQMQNVYTKAKIYKWLFGIDISQRMKIFSIYNIWFSKIIFQLLVYIEYEASARFIPTSFYENLYKKFNPSFDEDAFDYQKEFDKYSYELKGKKSGENLDIFFQKSEQDFTNQITGRDKEFLKEVKFYTYNELNDVITLSLDLLNSKEKIQEYFDTFSECKIFSEKISVIKNKHDKNILNFSIPSWIAKKGYFNVQQLIVLAFEQLISIYYQR